MDKANVRILFLVLIAVLFICQAVYDLVKKNRGRSPHNTPLTKPKVKQRTPMARQKPKPIKPVGTPVSPSQSQFEATQYETDKPITAQLSDDISAGDLTESQPERPPADDLRKAVIWSEILKRKF